MNFINRQKELDAIKAKLNGPNLDLYVIYGRRRIGKTTLALASVKGKDFIYYLATEENNLKKLKDVASRVEPRIKYVEADLEAIFNFLKDKIIIIDEFPNLIKENPKVVSELQRIVDVLLANTKTKLILLGSSISMMESQVLSYHAPLYGRKTGQLKLRALKFAELTDFFPESTTEERIEIYGFSDGIPFYLAKIDYPFWEWLDDELKKVDTFLKSEIDFLMKYEFRDVKTYKKILGAIASGHTKLGEIRAYIGAKGTDISPYLRNLIDVELVERKTPLIDNVKSRRSRYYISDNFVNFWFRFINPNITFIEEAIFSATEIKAVYNRYLGHVFERVCREFLIRKRDSLPCRIPKIGGQWGTIPKHEKGSNQYEIDIVTLDEESKELGFFECKYRTLKFKDALDILAELRTKSGYVDWNTNKRKEHFGLIAKKITGKETLRKEGFIVFDFDDF
ncbi:MAG: AAA family ATPase [Methanophagales archaeon]|nr:AAA family ATPase [Methanophagales archaeon]